MILRVQSTKSQIAFYVNVGNQANAPKKLIIAGWLQRLTRLRQRPVTTTFKRNAPVCSKPSDVRPLLRLVFDTDALLSMATLTENGFGGPFERLRLLAFLPIGVLLNAGKF
jgi:hypothetical protein